MKRFFRTAAWRLSSPRDRGEVSKVLKPVSEPEHERRLRALAQSGRILFLP
jgi:hypothetical protein